MYESVDLSLCLSNPFCPSVRASDRRSSPNITVVNRAQGGFKMRHESIGSQDSDNTSASSEFEHDRDEEMDTSLSPAALPPSRYIAVLSYCTAFIDLYQTVPYLPMLCSTILRSAMR